MTYTVKASHPGVDFGHVQTATFTDANEYHDYVEFLLTLGGWDISLLHAEASSVALVEGA